MFLNPDPAWLARDPLRRWSRTRFRHPQTGEPLIYTTNHIYDAAAWIAFIRIYYEADLDRPGSRSQPGPHHAVHPSAVLSGRLRHFCTGASPSGSASEASTDANFFRQRRAGDLHECAEENPVTIAKNRPI